jgi:hypothetical protein
MKDNYKIENKLSTVLAFFISFLLFSCGSYQLSTYDDDGIYNNVNTRNVVKKQVTTKEVPLTNNVKYYEKIFSDPVVDYGQNNNEQDVFTDVDSYSTQSTGTNTTTAIESYGAWEDADDNVTINVYTNPEPLFYNYWGPYNYWNNFYYTGWGFYGANWSWPYYGNHYVNYGYPYYNGYRNYGYAYGRRGYAVNSYYGTNKYNRRNAYTNNANFRRNNSRYGVNRSSSFRVNSRTRSRITNATPRVTPRSTPRSKARSTPRVAPRSTPRSTPRVTPRSIPRSTPRVTPRSSPRSTPRVSPRSSPRSTPRVSPRSTSRSSSRRGRG